MSSRRLATWSSLVALVVLVVLGVWLSIALPYRPRPVAGRPAAGVAAYTRRCPDLKLHVFNTGMNRMSGVLVPSPRPWRPVPAFAIEHGRAGLVLFDTGRIAVDPERAADVRNQVRAFARRVPDAAIIPGHDLSRVPSERADVVLHQRDWFERAAWRNLGD